MKACLFSKETGVFFQTASGWAKAFENPGDIGLGVESASDGFICGAPCAYMYLVGEGTCIFV